MPLCHLHRGAAGIVFRGVTRVTTGLIYLSAYGQSLGKTTTTTTSAATAQNGATTEASASAENIEDNNYTYDNDNDNGNDNGNGNHNTPWHPQQYREILSCQLSTSPRSLAVSPAVRYCRAPVIPAAASSTSTSTSTSKPTWCRFWGRRRSVKENSNPNPNPNENENAAMK